MLTIWTIAFVVGLLLVLLVGLCLWIAYWVVGFIVGFIYSGVRDVAYRKAEKRYPGIYARMQRYVDARYARLAAERKAKAERRKRANELADKRLLRWLDEHPGVVGGAGHSLSS